MTYFALSAFQGNDNIKSEVVELTVSNNPKGAFYVSYVCPRSR